MTMVYFNSGKIGLFYIGYDVYIMDSLDPWYAAYAAETGFYMLIITWKIWSCTKLTEDSEG